MPGGRVLARAPLGAAIAQRYGAPYWVIHRGDLQAVLLEAVLAHPDIGLHLGIRVEDFAHYRDGVTIAGLAAGRSTEARGVALVVADGLWSRLRRRLGDSTPPRFADHTAWRALAPAENGSPPTCAGRPSISGSAATRISSTTRSRAVA